jgi:hypothetical protein
MAPSPVPEAPGDVHETEGEVGSQRRRRAEQGEAAQREAKRETQ